VSRFFLVVLFFGLSAWLSAEDHIPERAYQYRKMLHAEVRRQWGFALPAAAIAIGGGTIQQESGWDPRAESPYAKGLTQFTDATWKDMVALDGSIAAIGDIWNPHAAIRAMCFYHRRLWDALPAADDDARFAFVLSAYNGGAGFLRRDQRQAAAAGQDPTRWFGHVELYSTRTAAAFRENRDYVRKILLRWRPLYIGF
jgi:membrane-bound lytic murein transglycosylase MltF